MKSFLGYLSAFILFLGGITFAQNEIDTGETATEPLPPVCEDIFTINGPEITYLGETLNYSLSPTIDPDLVFPVFYTLTLKNEEKTLQTSKNTMLQVTFDQEGQYILVADVNKGDCTYQIEKKLTTYKNSLLYIGENEEAFQLNFDQNFANDSTYFAKLLIDRNATEEDIKTLLRTELRHFAHTERVVIKYTNFDRILHAYIELIQQGLIDGEGKSIFIVSNRNQAFINRVLSLFIYDLSPQQVATVKNSDFLNFLTALSLHQGEEEIFAFASLHNLQEGKSSGFLFLSYFVDNAITNGVSLQILGTLLVISLLVLVISTLRQLVGLSVFGVYQPLLFALTLFLIGGKATLFFMGIAVVATCCIRIFSHYVHLLQSAKISFLVCLYVLLLLGGFWIDGWWEIGLLGKSLRSNGFIALPILIFVMVSDKLFTDTFKFKEKSGRISLIEFVCITLISRWMLQNQLLRTFLLSYPEMLVVVLLAIIIVGRFTGLQMFELIRFMPLIRKRLEDEEE